jgi:hypothetical protein
MNALLAARRALDRTPEEVLESAKKDDLKARQSAFAVLQQSVRDLQKKNRMPTGNYVRLWLQCPKCGALQYRDYVPYSLSNPILTTLCGHGRYEDLIQIAKIEQRVGKPRLKWSWSAP